MIGNKTTANFIVRCARFEDAEEIITIYNHFVLNTTVTFETRAIKALEMRNRIEQTLASGLPWLTVVDEHKVIGYCYASPWKGRSAYQHSVEVTVYIHNDYHGLGLGKMLYQKMFEQLETQGIHTVIAGIALPNAKSVALHEKLGMQKVAHFQQVGRKFDRWIDVGYWQGLLN